MRHYSRLPHKSFLKIRLIENIHLRSDLPAGVHFAKLPKKKVRPPPLPARPPLAVVVGVASAGKSYLSLSILGRREFRAAFKAGAKTTEATLVTGKGMTIIDTPGVWWG